MHLYTLDAALRREAVIDKFESLIWTERFQDDGELQLVVESSKDARKLLKSGVRCVIDKSMRVMEIDTVNDGVTDDGRKTLEVTGISLEKILKDRVAKKSRANLTTEPTWDITDKPADVLRKVFTDICVTGVLNQYDAGGAVIGGDDRIPFIQSGTLSTPGNIPEPQDPITLKIEPQDLSTFIKSQCEVFDLGYQLLRNYDQSQLYFEIYSGNDRTTGQSALSPVVFAPELDNLTNTRELMTTADEKNVAYVFNDQGFEVVYADGTDPNISGLDRKVLMVKSENLDGTPTGAQITAFLIQRGKEELAKHRPFGAFDGEIDQNSAYQYGRDYYLGDLVEVRNTDGATNKMRVTEQIFSSNADGDRSYPTLAINTFITPGSWLAWDFNQVWADLGTTEYWENQP
jgi:hypothetical protein